MPASTPDKDDPSSGGSGRFDVTHWSMVLLAGQSPGTQAEAALETLCRTYWKPLYAFVRRQGHSSHDAQDLTQQFFVRFLDKHYLALASRERGRFRSFLLKSLQHFLVNEWKRGQSQKRGGGLEAFPLDEEAGERIYQQQPAGQTAPENLYDRLWALTLLEQAMERLGNDYSSTGRKELFDLLKPLILTEGSGESHRRAAGVLGLSEGTVKVALHRLRRRFREAVRAEIAQTVSTPGEVEEELHCLMAALSG